jgi:hypothetical protein
MHRLPAQTTGHAARLTEGTEYNQTFLYPAHGISVWGMQRPQLPVVLRRAP